MDGVSLYATEIFGALHYHKICATVSGEMVVVGWEAMGRWADTGYHPGGILLLSRLVVMGGGAVFEIAEFIRWSLGDVNVGDYGNNALVLVANAAGAAVGVWFVFGQEPRAQGRGGRPIPGAAYGTHCSLIWVTMPPSMVIQTPKKNPPRSATRPPHSEKVVSTSSRGSPPG